MQDNMKTKQLIAESNSSCKVASPRFMQPLIPGFLNDFSIPVSFLKNLELQLKGHHLESVVLKTEDQPQRHWLVKIQNNRHFGDGWKEFALHQNLQLGDFLVFTHESHFLFLVSVYDPVTSCQRCFPSSKLLSLGKPNYQGSTSRTRFKFSHPTKRKSRKARAQAATDVTLTSSYISRSTIYLPKDFLRSSGLANRSCDIRLIDGKKNFRQARLYFKKVDGSSYITGEGLKDFQIAHGVKPGSVIRFELLEAGTKPTLKCSIDDA